LIRPVDGVVVESGLRACDIVVNGSVVGGGVTLSKVVRLDRSSVSSQPFPIDLIKIIRLHDETADNASAGRCLRANGDFSEEDIEVTGDGWCLSLYGHCKVCSICTIVAQSSTLCGSEIVACAFSEVDGDGLAESCVSWTCST